MTLDVAVVGASSAGLYAAEKLARAGKRVAVFEQNQTLDPARRTLIVTPRLAEQLGPLPSNVFLHQIEWIDLTAADGTSARIRFRRPDLIVERRALAHLLAERAQAAGARLCLGQRFRSATAAQDGAALTFSPAGAEQNGARTVVQAGAVIAADGAFSDVARALGLPPVPTAPILQAEVKLPAGWNPALTQAWFDTRDTRYFYWLIPESAERAVVGLVGDEHTRMRPALQAVLEARRLEPLAFQGARIAMYRPGLTNQTRLGSAPVLFVGDAAGQVKVSTVGGTVSGFGGADAAVRALLYGAPLWRELGSVTRELALHYYVRAFLERLDNAGYAELIRALNPRLCALLSEHHRDDLAPHAVSLLLSQPGLLKLGKYLFRRPAALPNRPVETAPSQTDPAL